MISDADTLAALQSIADTDVRQVAATAVGIIQRQARELELRSAEIAALRGVIEWTLGEGAAGKDGPLYWWRTEIRKRFDAIAK